MNINTFLPQVNLQNLHSSFLFAKHASCVTPANRPSACVHFAHSLPFLNPSSVHENSWFRSVGQSDSELSGEYC